MRFTSHITRIDRSAVATGSPSSEGVFRKAASHLTLRRQHRQVPTMTLYCVTDRLHSGRTVRVPGHEIAPIVAAWLAELGAHSTLVDDLARAACIGDWAAAYAVGNQLSVDVTIAAAA